MATITAKMVGDLRAATGLGMMECKKALVEADGDFEKAEEYYRKADKAGSIRAKCAMFMMVYENIKDEEKLKAYKAEYKAEKKPCKSFALEGIWDD